MTGGASSDAAPRASLARLALRSTLAALWFAAMFFALIPAGVLWLAGTPWMPEPGPHVWLGVGLIAACHLVLIPPIAAFVKEGRGTQAPFDPPRSLVTRGLYTRIRNPMYLVYTVVIVGEAMAFRSAWLAVYALFFWGLAHVYVVAVEEKTLRRRFGHRYEEYCRRVGRWLPRRRTGDRRA